MTAAFFLWYALYVLLSAYARGLHEHQARRQHQRRAGLRPAPVRLHVPDRLVYARYADRKLDPLADEIRAEIESGSDADDARPGGGGAPQHRPHPDHHAVPGLRRDHARHHGLGQPADQDAPPTSTPAAGRSPASRTAWRSAATTCRPRRSSASPASSPCTATTASSTRSASWSPGWSRCCWSRSCCATRASTRWPTCWRSGCGSGRYARRRRSPPSPCRSSTCWRRWSAPARWSRCCWASSPAQTFLGMDADTAKIATIILVGALMIIYVTVGGMKGTTYVQIVKAFLLMTGALVMTVLVLARVQVQPVRRCSATPPRQSGKGDAFLEPGLRYGVEVAGDATKTFYSKMDLLSLGIALVLGTAGLPHILIRFYTVPTAQGRPQERALGDRHHRHVLPDDPGAGLRRGGAGRQQGDHRAGQGRQHRRAAAGRGARRASTSAARSAARCCWRSSRRSRSPRSSRWSPG